MGEKNQQNYTISETYTLPSEGKIYEAKVNPTVSLRPMSARMEMQRLAQSVTPLKTLADIIENCMLEKPAVHVYDMVFGDYEYLLHKLRVVTYGDAYKISVPCRECGEIIDTEVSLSTLAVKEFDLDTFEDFRTFQLPDSGKIVKLKFQTPRILDSIDQKAKELKKRMPGVGLNFDTYAQLLLTIDTVDDKHLSSIDMDYFINELSAKDFNKILNQADKLNSYIGLDNILTVTCPKCGAETNTFFRFGPEFFRPTNI